MSNSFISDKNSSDTQTDCHKSLPSEPICDAATPRPFEFASSLGCTGELSPLVNLLLYSENDAMRKSLILALKY